VEGFVFGDDVNRTEKAEFVEQLREQLSTAKSVILTSYQGLEVNVINDLRAKFRAEGVEYHIIKNTLAKLAIKGTDMEVMSEHLTGPVAIAYSAEDAISPAKVIKDFAKAHEAKFTVKGAYLDGQMIDEAGVKRLADLPTKDELRVQFLLTLNAGPIGLLRTLSAGPQALLMVFEAKRIKEEG
jgi:large subunit ribosomal protein L10